MGVTYAILASGQTKRGQRRVRLKATFDGDYTDGGEPLTPSDAGLDAFHQRYDPVRLEQKRSDGAFVTSGHSPVEWDSESETLVVTDGDGEEVAGGTDLSGETIQLTVRGHT